MKDVDFDDKKFKCIILTLAEFDDDVKFRMIPEHCVTRFANIFILRRNVPLQTTHYTIVRFGAATKVDHVCVFHTRCGRH